MKKYKKKSLNPRFIKIMLTISLNFNSIISKNNILKYVSKNGKFFICILTQCSISSLFDKWVR